MKITYRNIKSEASRFANIYRKSHEVPELPRAEDLKVYKDKYFTKFDKLINLINEHLEDIESQITHGFGHLEYVSLLASYIANVECKRKKVPVNLSDSIVESAFLGGVLHDIDRHLGFGEIHMIVGEKTAKEFLNLLGVKNKNVLEIVRNHDINNYKVSAKSNDVAFGSVFDADHFMYGWEREDIFWKRGEQKNIPESEIIHDYQFLYPVRNAWRTSYGKKVGPQLIDFGLSIAKHIEIQFS